MELKKDLPIRPSEMGVINIITKREGKHTPAMIADLLGVSKPMVTSHISTLEEKGYVEKEYSAEDKRSVFIIPTAKAQELANGTEAKFSVYLEAVEKELGVKNFDKLLELLEKANQVLKEQ